MGRAKRNPSPFVIVVDGFLPALPILQDMASRSLRRDRLRLVGIFRPSSNRGQGSRCALHSSPRAICA